MVRVVIIGNSAAGFSASCVLAAEKTRCRLTVISQEDCLPYRRDRLLAYLAGAVKENDLWLADEEFYRREGIELVRGARVDRLDAKKKRLTLREGQQIEYDYLLICCGLRPEIPDIPGHTKDGVCLLYRLEDARSIKERQSIARTLILVGDPQPCLELSRVLGSKEKELKIVSTPRPQGFVPSEPSEWIDGLSVAELIGEGSELRALKLASGKVIGTDLVLYAVQPLPASGFLEGSGVRIERGYVVVDGSMRTSLENVFACGGISVRENDTVRPKSWEEAVAEGKSAAEAIKSAIERGEPLCQQKS